MADHLTGISPFTWLEYRRLRGWNIAAYVTVCAMALSFSIALTRAQVLFAIPGQTQTLSAEAHNNSYQVDGYFFFVLNGVL